MVFDANDLPTIGITMGDAAGIGPEIVLRSLEQREAVGKYNALIIGDGSHLRSVASQFGVSHILERDDVAVDDLGNLTEPIEIGTDNAVSLSLIHISEPTRPY